MTDGRHRERCGHQYFSIQRIKRSKADASIERFKSGLKISCGMHACLTPFEFTVLEYHQSRHRLNTIRGGKPFVFVYVNRYDPSFFSDALMKLLKNWVHHFARAAPSSEKIDKYRFFRLHYFFKLFHTFCFYVIQS